MSEKGRVIFYGLGAVYLLYLCYDLFQSGVGQGEATLPITIFCILFGVVGVLLLVLAVKQYKKYINEELSKGETTAEMVEEVVVEENASEEDASNSTSADVE